MNRTIIGIVACAGALGLAQSAQAIIAPFGTLKKAADKGHVAWFGGGSAVPIGENLFLTAKHVKGKAGMKIKLGKKTYTVSEVVDHPRADLSLVSITSTLSDWHNITFDAKKGDTVTLGGMGVMGERSTKSLFNWTNKRKEQWGQNSIDKISSKYITFDLDKGGMGVPYEAIVTPGDSGSGVFLANEDGGLDLAAITVAVSGPKDASTFGSVGYAVNLKTYKKFITSAAASVGYDGVIGGVEVTPVPAPGVACLGGVLAIGALRRRRAVTG